MPQGSCQWGALVTVYHHPQIGNNTHELSATRELSKVSRLDVSLKIQRIRRGGR